MDSDISVRSRFGDASDLLLPLFSLSVIVHRDFVIFRSGSVIELRERGGGEIVWLGSGRAPLEKLTSGDGVRRQPCREQSERKKEDRELRKKRDRVKKRY